MIVSGRASRAIALVVAFLLLVALVVIAEINQSGQNEINRIISLSQQRQVLLVELLSERARAAVAIGKLKRDTSLPIYEPDRERIVFENVQEANRGPLAGRDLVRIYERIIDVMRNVQKEEIVSKPEAAEAGTEFDSEVND